MTAEGLVCAINDIDEELIKEAEHISIVSKSKHFIKYGAVAAALVLCAAVGTVALYKPAKSPVDDPIDSTLNYGGYGSDANIGGDQSSVNSNEVVKIKGVPFTEDEISSVINENADIIALSISAQYGCFGTEIKLYTKGYCHASMGSENTVDLDYLTLPVCIDDSIVGSVVLFRAGDEIMYSLNAGGEIWNAMNEALKYSDDIIFAYGGAFASEIAIAPDNTIFPITYGAENAISDGEDWYSLLYSEYDTFSKAYLADKNNYISVISEDN